MRCSTWVRGPPCVLHGNRVDWGGWELEMQAVKTAGDVPQVMYRLSIGERNGDSERSLGDKSRPAKLFFVPP